MTTTTLKQAAQSLALLCLATVASSVYSQIPASAASTFVTSYKIIGAQGLPDTVLEPLLANHVMQNKTLQELRALAQEIERHLQTEQGLIAAKVWIPLLEDNLGEVAIRVMPGSIKGIRFAKPVDTATERQALSLLTDKLTPSSLLVQSTLEALAAQLTELLGASPTFSLVPTPVMGQFDLVVGLNTPKKYSLSVGLDNIGSRYTNTWRDKTQVLVRGVFTQDDTLSIAAQLLTFNQKAIQARYETSFGKSDYKLGLTNVASRFHLNDVYASLNSVGDTHVTAIDLSRQLVRSPTFNFAARAEVQAKRVRSLQANVPVADRQIQATHLGVFADTPLLGVSSAAHLVVTSGNVNMARVSTDLAADTANIAGSYQKTVFHAEHAAALGANQRLQINLNVQRARKNLDATEAMLVGGISGVRAYALGEAASDSGTTINLEFHERWNANWRGLAFYDQGWATVRQNPIAGATAANRYNISGAGFSLVWSPSPKTEIAIMPTWKLKTNPAANPSTGADADGSARRTRVWFFATQAI